MDDLGAGEQAIAIDGGLMRPTAISTSTPHPGSPRRNTITVVFHAQDTS
ncbi:hypothetical protein WME89_39700 [Sorangium sp. So ce321]